MVFSHLKVIELAAVLAGPSVGMFLAELGAEVTKIENLTTEGDVTRTWRLSKEKPENIAAYFTAVNWGKKSIALDLRKTEAQDFVHQLIETADVVISSYLPGAAEKLRMDSKTLLSLNPRLICAEINGYGEEVQRAAFDAIIQAESGFTYMNGLGEEINKMPVAMMDILAAHQLKEAILVAYIEREKTGKGKKVSVSLIEAGIASLANQAANWLVAQHIPQAIGSEHPNIVPYGTIYETADQQKIVLAVGNDAQFIALSEVLQLPVKEDFATNVQRVKHRTAVNQLLATAIQQQNREPLLEKLLAAKVPAGAVNTLPQVFELAQAKGLLLHAENLTGVRSFVAKGIETKKDLLPPPELGLPS
ncbi:MAG: CaiB/BaiF CoA transferase family protein [Bacteroidia bacterium]